MYFGVAAFNYSESEFPGEKRGTISSSCNTNSNNQLSLMDTFYFICITITTVGYGDITPQTIPGQVVIILLIIAGITIIPGLVADMQESLKMQQSGAGSYNPGRNPFIVICGLFNDTAQTIRVVRSILSRDKSESTTVVLLSRENLNALTKYSIKKSKYKNRVSSDLNRAQLKKAHGAIILANISTKNKRVEDDHNTLRAWAFSDYAPSLPLFVETLLPDTSIFQESITGGNGLQNEIYVAKINPVFIGKPFAEVVSYLFKEFQIILFALDVYIPEKHAHHVVLNPGLQYTLKECDQCFFIAPQSKFDKSESPDMEPISPDVVLMHANSNTSFDEYIKDYPPEAHRAKGDVFRFVCTLRSAHLTVNELKPILIMCQRPPNEKEFVRIANFPKVYFMIGAGNRTSDLLRAGVVTSDKVVLMNLSEEKTTEEDDPFGDSSAM
ncbi:hypothetical protein HDV01_003896 [Terramyces sp. JEL0728]|nr:hypothetical protein HDV01_003896 [Terramyces sp. JEL0728]